MPGFPTLVSTFSPFSTTLLNIHGILALKNREYSEVVGPFPEFGPIVTNFLGLMSLPELAPNFPSTHRLEIGAISGF